MSKVKYRVREFTPNENQIGTHSVFAETVINNEIGNSELAERIARRTGFKTYECQAIVAAIAEVVAEEVLESNRVSLADEKGAKLVSLYPRVSGSLSDNEVLADPDKYKNATKATPEMLTDDMLKWTIGATVGIKFSKRFSIEKQAQRVKFVSTDTAISNEVEPEEPGNTGGNTGGEEPGTGGETPGGNGGGNDPGTGGGGFNV